MVQSHVAAQHLPSAPPHALDREALARWRVRVATIRPVQGAAAVGALDHARRALAEAMLSQPAERHRRGAVGARDEPLAALNAVGTAVGKVGAPHDGAAVVAAHLALWALAAEVILYARAHAR